jgi:hypothetical protein
MCLAEKLDCFMKEYELTNRGFGRFIGLNESVIRALRSNPKRQPKEATLKK